KKAELDEVAFLLGKHLELWVGIEARIRDWISIVYRQPLGARWSALLAQIDPTRPAPPPVQAPAPAKAPAKAAPEAPKPPPLPAKPPAPAPAAQVPPELGPEPPTPVE